MDRCPDTDRAHEAYWRLTNLYLQAYDLPRHEEVVKILDAQVIRIDIVMAMLSSDEVLTNESILALLKAGISWRPDPCSLLRTPAWRTWREWVSGRWNREDNRNAVRRGDLSLPTHPHPLKQRPHGDQHGSRHAGRGFLRRPRGSGRL
jgi:hypothetical protein